MQSKDMNIIKLCDIREYFLAFVQYEHIDNFIEFAKKYAFHKQVYFTFLCLKLVFDDGYECEIMSKLEIDEMGFIDTFGDNTKNLNQISLQ